MVWVFLAVVTLSALVLLAAPLVRSRAQAARSTRRPAPERPDLTLYRAQLAEVNDEEAHGLISAADAATARLEIERRVLRASERTDGDRTAPVPPAARRLIAGGVSALVLLGTAGLYVILGSPHLPDRPSANRMIMAEEDLQDASIHELIDQLALRLNQRPDDLTGWLLLGRTAQSEGRFPLAIRAYENAVRLRPDEAMHHAALGQAHVGNDAGHVSDVAFKAFERAIAMSPENPVPRYYMGLSHFQRRNYEEAYQRWADLARDTPPDAPWADPLARGLVEAEQALAERGTPIPGPTAADITAADAMTPEDRRAMIDGMVSGLAARLEDEPDDLNGWLRLGQAYRVLGRDDEAIDAYRQVQRLDPDNAVAAEALGALTKE